MKQCKWKTKKLGLNWDLNPGPLTFFGDPKQELDMFSILFICP